MQPKKSIDLAKSYGHQHDVKSKMGTNIALICANKIQLQVQVKFIAIFGQIEYLVIHSSLQRAFKYTWQWVWVPLRVSLIPYYKSSLHSCLPSFTFFLEPYYAKSSFNIRLSTKLPKDITSTKVHITCSQCHELRYNSRPCSTYQFLQFLRTKM